jgi:K+-transporting ATPase ATPase A chain
VLAWPVGKFLAALCNERVPRWMQRVEAPLYKLAGTRPEQSMHWLRYALALLAFNAIGAFFLYALQRLQGRLPLNPAGMGAVSPDSAFNTAVSFVGNTNWQGYARRVDHELSHADARPHGAELPVGRHRHRRGLRAGARLRAPR